MINFPCGHLTLCDHCMVKQRSKATTKCLLCGVNAPNIVQLKKRPERVRYGHRRTFFVERQRDENKYEVQGAWIGMFRL
jgi:hypothetical protein